jgi:hypothetical protein
MPGLQRNRTVLALIVAVLVMASATPAALLAAPVSSTPELAPSGEPYVTVEKSATAVPPDGELGLRVTVQIDEPTSYLESRVQVRRPSGRLIYQKTQVRNEVETGTVTIEYERELDDLELEPGVYPIEVRVRSDSGEVREWIVNDELLVFDPEREATPMVLLTRFGCSLASDPEGRFVLDPSASSRTRDEADAIAAYSVANPDSSVGVLMAPAILEEWKRISEGYEYVGPEGVETVAADSETAQDHATSLSLLGTALDSGRLELIDVPYSNPDMIGLQNSRRLYDLGPHFERGLSAYLSALETTPQPIAATAQGYLQAAGLPPLVARGTNAAIVSSASVESTESIQSGSMIAGGSDIALLVVHAGASSALASAECTSFVRELFDWHLDAEEGAPIIVDVPLGAGSSLTVAELEECMDEVIGSPWVEMVPARDAALLATGTASLRSELDEASDAPADYWEEVAESRAKSQALVAAAGTSDPRGQAANDSSLLAQSRCWAGPDESWSFADRGRAFAAAATRVSDSVLDGITIAAKDITLSGAKGEVPVSVVNQDEAELTVTLKTISDDLTVDAPAAEIVTLRPSENLFAIPVDLKSSLSGTLRIEVWSDELLLDERDVRVRASYLDRLAIIAGVAIVLIVMLLFIRRRVVRASADTMDE